MVPWGLVCVARARSAVHACAARGEDDEHAAMPCCNLESTSKIGAVLLRVAKTSQHRAVLQPQR